MPAGRLVVALSLALLLLPASSARAQVGFEGSVNAGGAFFLADLAEEINGLTRAHESSLALGAKAGARWARFSLEGELSYVPTKVVVKTSDGFEATEDQNLTIFGVAALLNFPLSLQWEAFLAAGAGLKSYSAEDPTTKLGNFAPGFESGSDFTFNVGGGFRLWIQDRLNLRLDVRDYISTFDAFELTSQKGELTQTQHDLLVTLGLGWVPGGQPQF
jgi:hypothetical protein